MATSQQAKNRRKANSGSFKPGQSGNPGGRKTNTLSIVDNLRVVLEQVDGESGKTKGQLIAERYVELAMGGSVTAMEHIFARFHGRPEQGIRISGDDERPLHVRHSKRDIFRRTEV